MGLVKIREPYLKVRFFSCNRIGGLIMGEKTKLKLLYVLEILKEDSDEENILTASDIVDKLQAKGIISERRSVIRDIKTLEAFGYDISLYDENNKGYYLRSREFEEEELRILIDTVSASKSITVKKSRELIDKLKKLTSKHLGKKMLGQVYVDEKIKSQNERIYYNVNALTEAISRNRKVNFKYTTYNVNKKLEYRKKGKTYKVSPYGLGWHEDNYYLIGVHEKYDNISHYRVDRIEGVEILDEKRKVIKEYSNEAEFNMADYINKTFNMFTGDKKKVKIRFKNNLINPVIDKFGKDVFLTIDGDEYFIIHSEIIISQGFISWLLQFGSSAELIEPVEVREIIKEKVKELDNMYN